MPNPKQCDFIEFSARVSFFKEQSICKIKHKEDIIKHAKEYKGNFEEAMRHDNKGEGDA